MVGPRVVFRQFLSNGIAAAQYACEAQLQGPPVSSYNDGKEVLVTSLHWLTSEQHGPLLMVTYMHHSVQ